MDLNKPFLKIELSTREVFLILGAIRVANRFVSETATKKEIKEVDTLRKKLDSKL